MGVVFPSAACSATVVCGDTLACLYESYLIVVGAPTSPLIAEPYKSCRIVEGDGEGYGVYGEAV